MLSKEICIRISYKTSKAFIAIHRAVLGGVGASAEEASVLLNKGCLMDIMGVDAGVAGVALDLSKPNPPSPFFSNSEAGHCLMSLALFLTLTLTVVF